MTAHRLLTIDGGQSRECYACGLIAESDMAADLYDCRRGGWDHPPYLLADGSIETCAAHPYAAECRIDAIRFDSIGARFDAAGVEPFPGWIERAGRWS